MRVLAQFWPLLGAQSEVGVDVEEVVHVVTVTVAMETFCGRNCVVVALGERVAGSALGGGDGQATCEAVTPAAMAAARAIMSATRSQNVSFRTLRILPLFGEAVCGGAIHELLSC